jgi:hypothetical protein
MKGPTDSQMSKRNWEMRMRRHLNRPLTVIPPVRRYLLEKQTIAIERDAARAQVDALSAQRDSLLIERDTLSAELDSLLMERQALSAERDTLSAERSTLSAERSTLSAERDALFAERDAAHARINELQATLEALTAKPEPPAIQIDLHAARRHLKEGLVALAQKNLALAEQKFKLAEERMPPRHVPSHIYLFESYYADMQQPMDEADLLVSQCQHARILCEQAKAYLAHIGQIAASAPHFYLFYADYLREERQHPKKITPYGHRSFSANNEDGLISEIFKRIGTTNKYFVEFGVNDGVQCNTTALLFRGWRGLWLEASKNYLEMANYHFRHFIARGMLKTTYEFMTAENVNKAISSNMHPDGGNEIDFLSIDIDGNDYWVWQALECINPRVVVIEYNSYFAPPLSMVQSYDPVKIFTGTSYYGASLEALTRLSDRKGYNLVGCSLVGDNAFFVRKDLCEDKFHSPFTATEHYQPGRAISIPWLHAPGFGDYDIVEQTQSD